MSPVPGGIAVTLYALPGIPLIDEGDDLGRLIVAACRESGIALAEGDILVIAQKAVSKAEGRVVDLKTIVPSAAAEALAHATGRDARLCEVYIQESSEILGTKGRMVITRHRLGFECTGAGVDRSNVAPHAEERVVLLPADPDRSARRIRDSVRELTGQPIAVIVNDSFGRADREGSVGISIGFSGIRSIEERAQQDLYGNPSRSGIALVDEVAAAASIVMGQADEAIPAVLVRGVRFTSDDTTGLQDLLVRERAGR